MTILQAVAAGRQNREKRKEPKKKADRYFLDGRVADRDLKVCNLCKIVLPPFCFLFKDGTPVKTACSPCVSDILITVSW